MDVNDHIYSHAPTGLQPSNVALTNYLDTNRIAYQVHASCGIAFNRTAELKKIQNTKRAEQSSCKRQMWADISGLDHREMCLLCGEICLENDRNKEKRWKVAMQKTKLTSSEACDKRSNDEWAREVKGR
jgi:hypothetical protein